MDMKTDGQRSALESPKGLRTLSGDQVTVAPPPREGERSWARANAARTHFELAPPEEEGSEYVFERFIAHKWLEDGSLMLLVRLFGYYPRQDSWKKSTSLPRKAMRTYRKRKGVNMPDLPVSGVYFCNTTRRQVILTRDLVAQEKTSGRKNAKVQHASSTKSKGSPCGTPSKSHWVPHPRPTAPQPSHSR